ncbi:MAG TPA: hypothetical protein VFP96_17320 [Candidatus Acidoferrum sp.]|nr:hypothetical protein [Candidatus Acidoferrum sp.]
MSQLSEEEQHQLASDLAAAVSKFAPDWTDHQPSDPGITLLELFAWLSDNLLIRLDDSSARKADLLAQIVAKLNAMRPGTCLNPALERPRYFYGKLLTASDFQDEQTYARNMMKRHNRCVIGTGVVSGLLVSLDPASPSKDKPAIVVTPGSAIAPDGQLLCICEPLRCLLTAHGSTGYVVLRYCERAIDPVPALSGATEYARIEEGLAVAFEEQLPEGGIAIARLKRTAGRWTVDRKFRPRRAAKRS